MTLVFGLWYTGLYLQLSNVKPTQVFSAQAGRQVIYKSKSGTSTQRELVTSFQPLKGRRITRKKAYWQSFSLNCVTNIISQLTVCSHLLEEIGIFQWKAYRDS
jgi:hypothetical protein